MENIEKMVNCGDPSYSGAMYGCPHCGNLTRIDSYDGQNVTFHYNRHEDDAYVQKTLPVLDFIQLLIQHIPEKHFKMTRYYGLYARRRELDKTIRKAISPCKHKILLDWNKWRNLIFLSFGYDPLECPKCTHKMVFMELYQKHKRVPLEELYEKVMAPYRCQSKSPPPVNVLDFISHLSHTKRNIKMGGSMMNSKFLEELRQRYMKTRQKV